MEKKLFSDIVIDENKFKNILTLNNVVFSNLSIDKRMFYEDSVKKNIDIGRIEIIIFTSCYFESSISFKDELSFNFRFVDCEFDKLFFQEVKKEYIAEDLYGSHSVEFIKSEIKSLSINQSEFNGVFYINKEPNRLGENEENTFDMEFLEIKDTCFNKNFKLHNVNVDIVEIDNVDFEKNADFYKSKFSKRNTFMNINFRNLTIFEKCEFKSKFILEYVTFEGLVQFRGAQFFNGLNLDKTNIEKEINFYNINGLEKKESIKETSQETYRILKYNCERTGNIIEANKYHALELEKRKNNLSFFDLKNGIPFHINYATSKFGTSWFTALRWIIYVGFITTVWMHWCNFELFLEHKYSLSMNIIKYMSIIHFDELKEHPEIFLFNKVSLGYLYYQFVTAVRKDTRK